MARGFSRGDQHWGYAISVDHYNRQPRQDVEARRVTTRDELRILDHIQRETFGLSGALSDTDIEREFTDCTQPDARVSRYVAYVNGEPAGSAGLTLHPKLGLGFLWAGGVLERYRGQGAYTALLRARVDWAKEKGIEHVGLYAKVNTSAPIVEAQGFDRFGSMEYWTHERETHPDSN